MVATRVAPTGASAKKRPSLVYAFATCRSGASRDRGVSARAEGFAVVALSRSRLASLLQGLRRRNDRVWYVRLLPVGAARAATAGFPLAPRVSPQLRCRGRDSRRSYRASAKKRSSLVGAFASCRSGVSRDRGVSARAAGSPQLRCRGRDSRRSYRGFGEEMVDPGVCVCFL